MTNPMHEITSDRKFWCKQCGQDAKPIFDHNNVACHATSAGLYCTYGDKGQYFGNHAIVRIPINAEIVGDSAFWGWQS